MAEIAISSEICKKDGFCTKACTRDIFHQDEKGTVPLIDGESRCFGCGHCVAICPQGAISHSDYPEGSVTPSSRENIPSYDQVMELIHSRQSRRLFKSKPVEKEEIEKVLEASRFAPSGHNDQSTEFVVVQDEETMQKIATISARYLGKLGGQFDNPIGRTIMRFIMGKRGAAYVGGLAPELSHLAKLFEEGTDWVLRRPPVLVLFCADSAGGSFAAVNANLAVQNATLAAEALGLGCFYAGSVVLASEREKEIGRLLNLPEGHSIYGALAMGHPRLKFRNWPERRPARVTWV